VIVEVRIVDSKVLTGLMRVPFHKKMIALTLWFAWRQDKPVITSSYRDASVHDKDSGIHSTIPCRAVDWRSKDLTNPKRVVEDINNHWEYDPKRPKLKCAIYHDIGLGAHIHTQVHDRTTYYPNGKELEIETENN
jgi:hypothetical protein